MKKQFRSWGRFCELHLQELADEFVPHATPLNVQATVPSNVAPFKVQDTVQEGQKRPCQYHLRGKCHLGAGCPFLHPAKTASRQNSSTATRDDNDCGGDTLVAELHAFSREHTVNKDGTPRASALEHDRRAHAVLHVCMYVCACQMFAHLM